MFSVPCYLFHGLVSLHNCVLSYKYRKLLETLFKLRKLWGHIGEQVSMDTPAGENIVHAAVSSGPIGAIYSAIDHIMNIDSTLEDYRIEVRLSQIGALYCSFSRHYQHRQLGVVPRSSVYMCLPSRLYCLPSSVPYRAVFCYDCVFCLALPLVWGFARPSLAQY